MAETANQRTAYNTMVKTEKQRTIDKPMTESEHKGTAS
jgi:hypothetical protein